MSTSKFYDIDTRRVCEKDNINEDQMVWETDITLQSSTFDMSMTLNLSKSSNQLDSLDKIINDINNCVVII